MMKEGDLCYVPQAVQLFNQVIPYIHTTSKPMTGIFLEESNNNILLFINGQKLLAPKGHVYPMEEKC